MPKANLHAPLTILVVASELSGETQAAALMAALNGIAKTQKRSIRWVGVGGSAMQAQGLELLFPIDDLAVMGLLEIIPAIPRILQRLKQLKAWASHNRPDLILTVDGQDFSARLAKRIKPLGIPHVHYVAPKVWAWRQHRVHSLKNLYTHLLCNLPFEAAWFGKAGLPTTYVGHPMVEMLKGIETPRATALQLALLPGSRKGELVRHWPLMLATYRRLKVLVPALTGLLALPNEQAVARCRTLADWRDDEGLEIVVGEGRYAALAQCRAALAKSGTNNLELAFLNLPAVVCYRMNGLTYALVKRLIKVRYASLPNLLLNTPAPLGAREHQGQGVAYPEFIQAAAKPENLARALYPLLTQSKAVEAQKQKLKAVRETMKTSKPAAQEAAAVVAKLLRLSQGA